MSLQDSTCVDRGVTRWPEYYQQKSAFQVGLDSSVTRIQDVTQSVMFPYGFECASVGHTMQSLGSANSVKLILANQPVGLTDEEDTDSDSSIEDPTGLEALALEQARYWTDLAELLAKVEAEAVRYSAKSESGKPASGTAEFSNEAQESFANLLNVSPTVETESERFIEQARRLDEKRRTDAALDIIYDNINNLLTEGDYQRIDAILSALDPEPLSVDILLGLLTSTLPARTKLSRRRDFFSKVEEELRRREGWEKGLLTGLES